MRASVEKFDGADRNLAAATLTIRTNTMRHALSILAGILVGAHALAAEFDWKTRFSEGLVDADGKAVDVSTLKGKVVAVYHSAHWCPPCRAFTPQLVAFANAHKEKLAVVFVSYDRTPADMTKYMKETSMPWAAVPFKAPSGKKIADENGIRGIPSLVVYGRDGALVTKNGRNLDELAKILK